MNKIRFLRVAFCVLSASAALAACGSDDPERQQEPPEKSVWEQMQECGLTGQFRVTTEPMATCEDWPRDAEIVSVEGDGNAVFLRAGLVELPVSANGNECTFVAAGCAATPASEDGTVKERYFAPTMELRKGGAGAKLIARAVDVLDKYVGPCSEATFELAAATEKGCNPIGEYEATAAASIVSGECNLTWGPGTVTVTKDADGYVVDWAGTTIDDLTLDPATCTLHGIKGTSTDLWIYNSVNRTAEIELRFADGALKGSVKDKLEGMTFDGKVCPGATFDLATSVAPPRETRPLEATCSAPPPAACGDGVCEGGETCTFCSDCACGDDKTCAPDGACRVSCTLLTEATACAAGERCSAVGSGYESAIFPSDALFCETAGAGKQGDTCSRTSDCGAGLLCHVLPKATTQGSCSPPCGAGFPDCMASEICGNQGDGTGDGYYSGAVKACEHQAGPGEDCTIESCQTGLGCVKSCTNGDCSTYCTKKCASDFDCPSEIPVCKLSYCEPKK